MKTKTTNQTKIGKNANTRNFFQKAFILLTILAFSSFGFKAKAQQYIYSWSNVAHSVITCGGVSTDNFVITITP